MNSPESREDLEYLFNRVSANVMQMSDPDMSLKEFSKRLIPRLVMSVPNAAFDPILPRDEGVVFYHGEIEPEEIRAFQHELLETHLNLDPKIPLTLHLSSFGGEVASGFALVSTIHDLQRRGRIVNAHVQGVAMSMASVIVQAANYRTMESSGVFMLHEVQYAMAGGTANHADEVLATKMMQEQLFRYYSARTGRPIDYYREKTERRNWYLNAEQTLEEGLIDAVLPPPPFDLPAPTKLKITKAPSRKKST